MGMFTIPEFRGRGIMGKLILEAILIRQADNPHNRAVAFVDVNNRASRQSHRKIGFRASGHIGAIGLFGIRLNYVTGRNALPKTKTMITI
jgi:L-amino acid N-acyltransferase YncA